MVHNYVIWRLVMDLMPHMPPQYEATRAEFRRVLLGVLTDRYYKDSICSGCCRLVDEITMPDTCENKLLPTRMQ